MSPTPDPRAIRELAYRLWEEHGRPEGSAEAHWLEAERQLSEVHEAFASSDVPAIHGADADATDANASLPTQLAGQVPGSARSEYTPESPPVNAEFKWAAAQLDGADAAAGASRPVPVLRRTAANARS